MIKKWTRLTMMLKRLDSPVSDTGSFSVAVDQATERLEQYLLNDMQDTESRRGSSSRLNQKAKLIEEVKQYFSTGTCGPSKSAARSSVNTTFLQPITGNWVVHYASCPFEGYIPIPWKVVDEKNNHQNGSALFRYCHGELKKLLVDFRERMEGIKFYFHPCDALDLCFDDSLPKFDVIDTSNLADHVGLVNLLTSGARKLRSYQSVMYTESMMWSNSGSSEALYLQEVLCCPLSLIPTFYGLRLMDNVELGPETLGTMRTLSISVSRFRWKRALPFVGVELSLSPALDQSLKYLRAKCFTTVIATSTKPTGMESYSPLTFQYVLSDLILRGGNPSALIKLSFLGIPPVFRKSIEANQAWMEQRPVWRIKVVILFTSTDQAFYNRVSESVPLLRLLLVPIDDFLSLSLGNQAKSTFAKFTNANSTENHFVDNIKVDLKLNPRGLVDQAEISFLLEDPSLLQTHCGLVIEQVNSIPVFMIGLFHERPTEVELFDQPYPWKISSIPSPNTSRNLQLVAENCLESKVDYKIRLKFLSEDKDGKPVSGTYI